MGYDMIAVMKAAVKRRKRVIQMRNRGMTFEEIGMVLGVSRQRAQSIFREARKNGAGS